MDRRTFLNSGVSAFVAPLLLARDPFSQAPAGAPAQGVSSAPATADDGWISLFNGRDLNGWYTFLQRSGKNTDPKGYVKVEQGMIHIMGNEVTDETAESGYLSTDREYDNIRIRVEYKWGTKRFPPRPEAKRDNGLLYYLSGRDVVWPTCVECQIQESDVGDVYLLGNTRATQAGITTFNTRAGGPGGRAGAGGPNAPGGAATGRATAPAAAAPGAPTTATSPPAGTGTPGATAGSAGAAGTQANQVAIARRLDQNRLLKEGDFENRDDWNVVEVIAAGNRAAHIVNGRIVNALGNIQQPDPQNAGQFIPLTKGKIALEIEYAEIWYRSVKIKPLA